MDAVITDMLGLMSLPPGDAELVQIVDTALADAARRAGSWLACKPGCTQCCHGAFSINALDAVRLHTGMQALQSSDPDTAQVIQQRAHEWIAQHGAGFPGDTKTGILGTSDEDQLRFDDFANDAACPALNPATGLCDIYAWRPMTCRVFGPPSRPNGSEALACCELCFVGATEAEIAACAMPLPEALENELLAHLDDSTETVVAFALLRAATT